MARRGDLTRYVGFAQNLLNLVPGVGWLLGDDQLTLRDDADPSKRARFQTSGITTGTTRTYALPDADGTLLLTAAADADYVNVTGDSMSGDLNVQNANLLIERYANDANPPGFVVRKSRSATLGAHTVVNANDELGRVPFRGSDGSAFRDSSRIAAFVDGTPGASDMPGRLVFSTTPDGSASLVERLRIASTGNVTVNETGTDSDFRVEGDTDANLLLTDASTDRVGVGTAAPTTKLDVNGTVNASAFSIAGAPFTPYTDEMVDDRVDALITDGAGIQTTYDDAAGTLTVASTITQYTDEQAQDAVGGILANSTHVSLTYVDSPPSITADVSGFVGVTTSGTFSDLDANFGAVVGLITDHAADTSTHGVAVAIVGTTEVQTLTNKTLTSPALEGAIVVNDLGADADFRVEGDTADQLFVCDAGLDAVRIGTTVAGALAHFRTAGIVLNDGGLDTDVRIEGDTDQNLLYTDASTDRVGIGTSTPTQLLDVDGTARVTTLNIGGTDVTATAAELNFTDGVTSAIQTQLDGKAATVHAHAIDDLTDVAIATPVAGDILVYDGAGWVNAERDQAATIATGAITLSSGAVSAVVIDTEGGAASDTLDTINGGVGGQVVVFGQAASSRDVTVAEGGNIQLAGSNFNIATSLATITLVCRATGGEWREVARSANP